MLRTRMQMFAVAVVATVFGTPPALAYDPICDHNFYVCMVDAAKRTDERDRYYAELECYDAYYACRGEPLACGEGSVIGHERLARSVTDSSIEGAEQEG